MENELSTIDDNRDQKLYYFHETPTRHFTVFVLKSLVWFILKVDAKGSENLPEEGPVVLVCNHVTTFDIFPMQLSIDRPVFFMAKEELMRNPIMEYFLRKGGAFPVYRNAKDEWAKQHAEKVLEHGQVLGIFPEGTRSKGRGLRTAKTGAARFAIKANCPIVPMALDGSHRVFENFPKRTTISATIGKPIYPQPNESPLGLTDRVMFAMATMLPEELRGVYAQVPPGFEIIQPDADEQPPEI